MNTVIIQCGAIFYGFSISQTGTLDYCGQLTEKTVDTSDYQELVSSLYFAPARYAFIAKELQDTPKLFIKNGLNEIDADTLSFLTHIGALLQAVHARDSLLAGELYLRRKFIFDKFATLVKHITNPLAVEIVFSLMYATIKNSSTSELSLIYAEAKKVLKCKSTKELTERFVEYLRTREHEFTVPIVGKHFYNWDEEPEILEKLCYNKIKENLGTRENSINDFRTGIYSSLNVAVQAEPYNSHDDNAIAVYIDDIKQKLYGTDVLVKVGHLRATCASMIRSAHPEMLRLKAKLQSIGFGDIVLKITV